jgi:hypothetical protein
MAPLLSQAGLQLPCLDHAVVPFGLDKYFHMGIAPIHSHQSAGDFERLRNVKQHG